MQQMEHLPQRAKEDLLAGASRSVRRANIIISSEGRVLEVSRHFNESRASGCVGE